MWGTELTSDRVITMEEEVARAKSAKESDSKVMIRKVLASSVPTTMPVTQAYRNHVPKLQQQKEGLGYPSPG